MKQENLPSHAVSQKKELLQHVFSKKQVPPVADKLIDEALEYASSSVLSNKSFV